MGFRFRRRIKILPGVSVNLGKTGASLSVGVKGAKVTVGKKGTRTTVGLPGSGLSYTTYSKHANKTIMNTAAFTYNNNPSTNNTSTAAGIVLSIGILLLFTKLFAIAVILILISAVVFWYNNNLHKKNLKPAIPQKPHSEDHQSQEANTVIICPDCRYSFNVENTRIPLEGRDFYCPKCTSTFYWPGIEMPS